MTEEAPLRPIHWVGSVRRDLRAFPEPVRDVMGYALYLAQCGERHRGAKPLSGPLRGLMRVSDSYRGKAYRLVYTVKLGGAINVLHAFEKKAKKGAATPRTDVELIRRRFREAHERHSIRGE